MREKSRHDNEPLAWLVRGGRDGEIEGRALTEGLAIVAWRGIGDISACENWQALKAEVRRAYPEAPAGVVSNWTGQLWRFSRDMEEGDLVVMPLRRRSGTIAVGRVTGPYEYRPDAPPGFRQTRKVEWIRKDIPYDAVRSDLRASTTSLLTVCALSRNNAARRIAHLAEHGVDPGDGEMEVTTAAVLLEDAVARGTREPRRLTIRSFLEHWGAARRTGATIEMIKADLAERGLTTQPPFTEGSMDTEIALVPLVGEPDADTNLTEDTPYVAYSAHTEYVEDPENPEDVGDTEDVSAHEPMTLRLGSLPAPLVSVPMSAELRYAKTLMLTKNFSQLAVIDDDGTFHGAISWESIGHAHLASADPTLSEVLTAAVVADHDARLLDQIEVIYDRGYIFVRDADRSRVTGIVTAADLTRQFGYHARPFILIEEAENRLRRAASVFGVDELRQAVPRHQRLKVHQAADLNFGNYPYLLEDQGRWEALGWNIDHGILLDHLRDVRKVRNELMHFSPDPLSDDQYRAVHGLLALLRAADPRP